MPKFDATIGGAIVGGLLLVGILVVVVRSASTSQKTNESEVARIAAMARTDPAGALKAADVALARDPRNADVLALRGLLYLDKAEQDQAAADFDRSLEIDPENVMASAGRCNVNRHGAKTALADCDRALASTKLPPPLYSETLAARARIERQEKAYDRALADATRAVEIAPTPFAYSERGKAHFARGDLEEAYADFAHQAVEDPLGHYECALVRDKQERLDDAIAETDSALAKLGSKISVEQRLAIHRLRAHVRSKQHDEANALAEYTELITIKPDVRGYNGRAWAEFKFGRLDAALADANKAVELEPKDPHAVGTRCWIESAQGSKDAAERDCTAALELRADGSEGKLDAGMLALLQGKRNEAATIWTEALTSWPEETELLEPWIAKAKAEGR